MILLAAQFHSANAAILFFVLISFTANSTHSILGSAAPMDIGGRRMAGFAKLAARTGVRACYHTHSGNNLGANGAAIANEETLTVTALDDAEIVLVDTV